MPIRRTKRWKEVNAALRRQVEQAVARSAVFVQAELKKELSKPGTGRFYARSKATRGIAGSFGELSRGQALNIMVNAEARHGMRLLRNPNAKKPSMRGLGIHRASAPGHPPAVDTGHLRRSMQVNVSKLKEANPRARVGTNVKYAPGLEYGTSRVAKRPYFRTVSRRVRPQIKQFFSAKNLIGGVTIR